MRAASGAKTSRSAAPAGTTIPGSVRVSRSVCTVACCTVTDAGAAVAAVEASRRLHPESATTTHNADTRLVHRMIRIVKPAA